MKNKRKIKVFSILFIFIITLQLAANIYFQCQIIQANNKEENLLNVENSDELADLFLQVDENFQQEYLFSAFGECIIGVEIIDTDITTIKIDDEEVICSYGFNVFYEDFGLDRQNHIIDVSNPSYLSRLYVQPLIIEEE